MSTNPPSMLTASDRCDRCGAQAYVVAVLDRGADLLFCAHHARQYADTLREVAVIIHDETDRLVGSLAAPSLLQV